MRTLSRDEVDRASFRDGSIVEFDIAEGGRSLTFMVDGVALGDGNHLERTTVFAFGLRQPLKIARVQGSYSVTVSPGYASNIGHISEFATTGDRLRMTGGDRVQECDYLFEGEIATIEAWIADD